MLLQIQESLDTNKGSAEKLRDILSAQQKREVGNQEAREIGISLLEFYEILAEEVCDETIS